MPPMPGKRRRRDQAQAGCLVLVFALVGGLGAAMAIIGVVFASGATFGQRCARLHPDGDPATIERCVSNLAHR